MRNLVAAFLAVILTVSSAFAATIEQGAKVAVMDFGTHPYAVTIDINILNAGKAAHEYILQRLFESQKMDIMLRHNLRRKILILQVLSITTPRKKSVKFLESIILFMATSMT